ncbi:MAG: flagellar basal body-associated FliL family protein [Candidatus Kapabacteria bacterium]|nr:flagellar basal body-associated FliL family protein [Candidatus Kapabacteria bacterium]MDW8012323.1 flagellar basal body-associated FliL family protein [Bacteroidota bacterium]
MAGSKVESKEGSSKRLSLPVIIGLMGGAVALQVVVLVVVLRTFVTPPSGQSLQQHGHKEITAEATANVPTGVIVPVDDLVVNPRGSSSRYVLVALGLEVANPKEGERLRRELMIPVRDRIMSVVSSYSVEELQTVGIRDSLRMRIRQELELLLPEIHLRNVYFSKFVIQ